jgi:hypothetical protein
MDTPGGRLGRWPFAIDNRQSGGVDPDAADCASGHPFWLVVTGGGPARFIDRSVGVARLTQASGILLSAGPVDLRAIAKCGGSTLRLGRATACWPYPRRGPSCDEDAGGPCSADEKAATIIEGAATGPNREVEEATHGTGG